MGKDNEAKSYKTASQKEYGVKRKEKRTNNEKKFEKENSNYFDHTIDKKSDRNVGKGVIKSKGRNIGERIVKNIGRYDEGNGNNRITTEENTGRNVGRNVEGSKGRNTERSTGRNVEGSKGRNTIRSTGRNAVRSIESIIERDAERNISKSTGINIERSKGKNRERKIEGNISKTIEKNQRNKNISTVQDKKAKKKKSMCPVVNKCGGCRLLHQSYEQQLKDKQKLVEGLINKFCKVGRIIGMDNPYHYRNKVHAVFDHDRKGNPISGVYEPGTHRVVPVESCLIENEKADAIIGSIRGLLKSFKIKTYDEDTGYGLLRHVLVRVGYNSGEIMVVLVLGSPILPSKSNFVKALRKIHPEITTIIINVNNKKTSMVLGEKEQVIYGKGFIEDTLCNKVFRISPKSFYQVNPVQTEVLYSKAIEYAQLTGKETIIDAYCGIGTIGIIASEHVKKVIGVELNKDAVKDAILNAKRNNVSNIDFYNKDAGEFMSQMAEQNQTVDFVFMDPPRAGSDEKFLSSLYSLKPKKVVYISCNPVTLERDLVFLTKKGYKVQKAVPVDMFPGTEHVESIILMTYCGLGDK